MQQSGKQTSRLFKLIVDSSLQKREKDDNIIAGMWKRFGNRRMNCLNGLHLSCPVRIGAKYAVAVRDIVRRASIA